MCIYFLKCLIRFDFVISFICPVLYWDHRLEFSLLGMLLTPRGICSLCEDLTNSGAGVDLAQWADWSSSYGIHDKNISHLSATAFTNIFKESIPWVSKLNIGNVLTWKRCPHYWPFALAIHLSPVVSPYKGTVMQAFDIFFVESMIKGCTKRL